MDGPRLTPTMSSRKTMVLDFVTTWIGAHPGSWPSLLMIGRGTGISKERAAAIVRQLVKDKRILRRPGTKGGLMLPGELDKALHLLRAAGAIIDSDFACALAPLTFSTLPMLPPDVQIAEGDLAGGGG